MRKLVAVLAIFSFAAVMVACGNQAKTEETETVEETVPVEETEGIEADTTAVEADTTAVSQ